MSEISSAHRIQLESAANGRYSVRGFRCPNECVTSASYLARCPRCGAEAEQTLFPGVGTVWSATTLRIPNGAFPAGRVIAYVDLDEGPRILCEVEQLPQIGSRASLRRIGVAGTPVAVIA